MKIAVLALILLSAPAFAADKKETRFKCWEVRIAVSLYGSERLESWARTRYSEAAIQAAKKCLSRNS